jgi:hypothetical protein
MARSINRKSKPIGSVSLANVRQYFPRVERVVDADKNIKIEVNANDNSTSTIKDHKNCALAVACKRTTKADGVMISTRTAYIIHGKTAYRFRLPESVSREIVSFDRRAGFALGTYMLNAPSKWEKLGAAHTGKTHNPSERRPVSFRHFTTGIRTALGHYVSIS